MKGIVYIMEAILGAILILVGIMLIFPSQQNEPGLSENGYNCLVYLDQKGLLKNYVENSRITDLNNSLKQCLPPIFDFKFKICATSNCIDTTIPYDKPVYLSSYLIAGENTYNKALINLWIWSK